MKARVTIYLSRLRRPFPSSSNVLKAFIKISSASVPTMEGGNMNRIPYEIFADHSVDRRKLGVIW